MIDLLMAFAVIHVAVVPPEARPPFVRVAIEAIAAKDAGRIAGSFTKIVQNADGGSRSIAAKQAVEILSSCSQKEVRSLNDHLYVISFQCPAHRADAASCDSGKLNVIVDGDRDSLTISHERKISASCRPVVPIVQTARY